MLNEHPFLVAGIMHSPYLGEYDEDGYTSHEFILTQEEGTGIIHGYWALTAVGQYTEFKRTFTSVGEFEDFLWDCGYTDVITGEF